MARLKSVWVDPASVANRLLVNRAEEKRLLLGRLDELQREGRCEATIGITGDRGVGKSIFTRAIVGDFAISRPAGLERVIPIVVDGLAGSYRMLLKTLATRLVDHLKPTVGNDKKLASWLDQLALLTSTDQISESHTQQLATKYGVDATVGLELLAKLNSRFAWEQSRQTGQGRQTTRTVTDAVLQSAIIDTLVFVSDASNGPPWTVVVFFDNLDQTLPSSDPDRARELFVRVQELRPCILLTHVRSELAGGDIARTIVNPIDLGPLIANDLMTMLKRRVEQSQLPEVREIPGTKHWAAFERLAQCAVNPLAFLTWCQAMCESFEHPLVDDWHSDRNLMQLVRTTYVNSIGPELMRKTASIIDRCRAGAIWPRKEDLLRGMLVSDTRPAVEGLTREEFDDLTAFGALLRRYRFNEDAGYRLDPVADILRPSLLERLRN